MDPITERGRAALLGALLFAAFLAAGCEPSAAGTPGGASEGSPATSGGTGASALGLPEEGEITIVAMPDIQWYSLTEETISADRDDRLGEFLDHFDEPGQGPETLRRMHRWILEHREEQRLVFVSFLGDLVERGRNESSRGRWETSRASIDLLHGEIPYGLAVGNHDMVTSTGETPLFEEFFGEERYRGFDWYLESHRNNVNSVQQVVVGADSLLFLHLTCNAPDDDLAWADGVLRRHPGHHTFISTHMLLGPVGRDQGTPGREEDNTPVGLMEWTKCHGEEGNHARESWDRLFSRHPQVVAVLSGDQSYYQAAHQSMEGEAGNTVHLLMSDYKQISKEGYLRLLRYHPGTGRIRVITWSPILDRALDRTPTVPDPLLHNFELSPASRATASR